MRYTPLEMVHSMHRDLGDATLGGVSTMLVPAESAIMKFHRATEDRTFTEVIDHNT